LAGVAAKRMFQFKFQLKFQPGESMFVRNPQLSSIPCVLKVIPDPPGRHL
jgi:hypothetical protein